MRIYEVIIIGAGPSGISCAIQLARYGVKFLIFEKKKIGGLLLNANLVENYPGFSEGIRGIELVDRLRRHLKKWKIKVRFEEVKECDFKGNIFVIKTDKKKYFSQFLVVATGTSPKKIKNKGITSLPKERVFYEVYHLFHVKNKKIAIIGAGDAAFDYALNLCRNNEVFILNRSNVIKALPLLVERIRKKSSVRYLENIKLKESQFKKDKVILIYEKNGEILTQRFDFLLIAIGREPNIKFLSDEIIKREKDLKRRELLYFIGDVKRGVYRQVAICCGDGILCAMKIYRRLKDESDR